MKKLSSVLAIAALALIIVPGAASAHGKGKGEDHRLKKGWPKIHKEHKHAFPGTVTALGAASFSMKAENGKVYVVNTTGAQIENPFGVKLALADLKINDKIIVKGTLSGTIITATRIIVTPQNIMLQKSKKQ